MSATQVEAFSSFSSNTENNNNNSTDTDTTNDVMPTTDNFWPDSGNSCQVRNCNEVRLDHGLFCPLHTCSVDLCRNHRSLNHQRQQTIFCDEHRCESALCHRKRFVDRREEHGREYDFCQECLCSFVENGEVCPNARNRQSPYMLCTIHSTQFEGHLRDELHRYQYTQQSELAAHDTMLRHELSKLPCVNRCLNVFDRNDEEVQCSGFALVPNIYCDNCLCVVSDCCRPVANNSNFCVRHVCQRDNCRQRNTGDSMFCVEHHCQSTLGTNQTRCTNGTIGESWFCSDHICHYEECENQRESGDFYCSLHYDNY